MIKTIGEETWYTYNKIPNMNKIINTSHETVVPSEKKSLNKKISTYHLEFCFEVIVVFFVSFTRSFYAYHNHFKCRLLIAIFTLSLRSSNFSTFRLQLGCFDFIIIIWTLQFNFLLITLHYLHLGWIGIGNKNLHNIYIYRLHYIFLLLLLLMICRYVL